MTHKISVLIADDNKKLTSELSDYLNCQNDISVCAVADNGKEALALIDETSPDVVILDMEAGLEHLARGTTSGMEQFIVVIEPGARSIQTYRNVKRLALELGVKQVRVVASKVRDEKDEQFILEKSHRKIFLVLSITIRIL